MAEHEHITAQQITDLIDYIDRFTATQDALTEYPEIKDLVEQEDALARLYEACSPFGKKQHEIIQGAQRHVLHCPDCIQTYDLTVKRSAYDASERNLQGMEGLLKRVPKLAPEGMPKAMEKISFTEDFGRWVTRYDVLRILK